MVILDVMVCRPAIAPGLFLWNENVSFGVELVTKEDLQVFLLQLLEVSDSWF